MTCDGGREGNAWLYSGVIPFQASGQHGFAVRILPKNADLSNPYEPGLLTWG
jgi:starch phosphorylase